MRTYLEMRLAVDDGKELHNVAIRLSEEELQQAGENLGFILVQVVENLEGMMKRRLSAAAKAKQL